MRAIIVEDEFLLRLALEDMVAGLGYTVTGVAGDMAAAIELASNGSLDFAILDCNLNGASIEPVARLLGERGIPVLLVTGYGNALPDGLRGHPVVEKPYDEDGLRKGIESALKHLRT